MSSRWTCRKSWRRRSSCIGTRRREGGRGVSSWRRRNHGRSELSTFLAPVLKLQRDLGGHPERKVKDPPSFSFPRLPPPLLATYISVPSNAVSLTYVPRSLPVSLANLSAQPYCHTDIVPSHPPSKLHYCDLLHSYLDPPSTTASTAPRLASLVPATTAFPNALATLSPGRRGAFLIPLSQPLPYARSTPPSWEPATEKGTISWTDDRLRELWNLLDDLHKRGRMGDLFCEAVFEGETSPNLPLLARGTGDHLRLWVDAQLALPFRSFLRLLSVGWMRGEKEGDRVQFLRTAKLVWVNEQGRAAFLA